MKKEISFFIALLLAFSTPLFGQSGDFALTQSVIASGGGQSSTGGTFAVAGTIGQPVAGTNSSGGDFSVSGGFWTVNLAPTAAAVSVGGRVVTANGLGVRNARVLMTAPSGETRSAVTGSFGYFRFADVLVGEAYVFQVYSKRFVFNPSSQVRLINEAVEDIIFIAGEQ